MVNISGLGAPTLLFVPAEGVNGLEAQGFFLEDQLGAGHFEDLVCSREAHLVLEALREPERFRKTELLLGGIVGKLGSVDIHILEVELRETAFFGKGDAGLAQGKIEMDAGVIDLILGFQGPYTVNGARKVTGMTDTRHPAGGQQGQAGDNRRKQHFLHGHSKHGVSGVNIDKIQRFYAGFSYIYTVITNYR